MGKARQFSFKEKLDIIFHYENLVASGIEISKKTWTEWANVKFDTSVSQMTVGRVLKKKIYTYHFLCGSFGWFKAH